VGEGREHFFLKNSWEDLEMQELSIVLILKKNKDHMLLF
jgi:hypothetical protein